MSPQRQLQKRGSSKFSYLTPTANLFKPRSFGKGIPARSAELPKTNPLQTRPFGSPIPASAQPEETQSASEQLEIESRFGYKGLNIPVNPPEPPPSPPPVQRKERGLGYWYQSSIQRANPVLNRLNLHKQQTGEPTKFSPEEAPTSESELERKGNAQVSNSEGSIQRLCSECESKLSEKEEDLPVQAKLRLGLLGDKYEQEADTLAAQVVDKINVPIQEPSVQRHSELGVKPKINISIERSTSVIRRLTSEQFRTQLGSTPEQKAAIDTLFANPTFVALWNYLKDCQATPQQDLGPLRLRVTPGLRINGVERFGGYNPLTKTLEINPTKAEHVSNPTELVDTIVHEMIHAVDDLQAACIQAGSPPAPLHGAATQRALSLADVAGTPDEARLMTELGPGASNPCEEFIDINAAAQQMIVQILTENIQVSRVGRPTLTFVNVILRRNPAAMSEYEVCRGNACALPDQNAKRRAIARCSAEIIGKYIPPDLLPSLLPTRVYFDFGAERLRPDSVETLDLVGLFLMSHPDTSVNLTGHADPVGSEAVNLRMGQLRAEAVAQQLISKGVDPKQILSVTSQGEANPLSTSRDTHWKDRRVEVVPS